MSAVMKYNSQIEKNIRTHTFSQKTIPQRRDIAVAHK